MRTSLHARSRCISLLLLLALWVPTAFAVEPPPVPALTIVNPDWQAMLQEALRQRDGRDVAVLHTEPTPGVLANIITSRWYFRWNTRAYWIVEENFFVTATRIFLGEQASMKMLGAEYAIFSETGTFVGACGVTDSGEDRVEYLALPRGKTLVVTIRDGKQGQREKTFTPTQPLYADPIALPQARMPEVRQKFNWCEFNIDTLDLVTFTAVVRERHAQPTADDPRVVTVEITDSDDDVYVSAVDANLRLVRAEMNGLRMVACTLETALEERARRLTTALTATTPMDRAITVDRPLAAVTVRVFTEDGNTDIIEANARQRCTPVPDTPGALIVTLLPERYVPSGQATRVKAPIAEELRAALRSTSEYECHHPDIRKTARTIVEDEQDPFRQSVLLSAWVCDHVTTTYSVLHASALETLCSLQGDCTESSVLFVALARALGIPARQVNGWRLVDREAIGHAWAEVYVGRWVEIDPTTSGLADATYLRERRAVYPQIDRIELLDERFADRDAPANSTISRQGGYTQLQLAVTVRGGGAAPLARSARQRVRPLPGSPGIFLVTLAPESLPSTREHRAPLPKTREIRRALQAEPGIESDRIDMACIAASIALSTGGSRLDYALLLARYTAQLEYDCNPEWRWSAMEICERGHANTLGGVRLYLALARAQGIPARAVTGWRGAGTGYRSHTWVEVYLGRWVEIDPSTGKLADATCLRRASADAELTRVELRGMIGQGVATQLADRRLDIQVTDERFAQAASRVTLDIPGTAWTISPVTTSWAGFLPCPPPTGTIEPTWFLGITWPGEGKDAAAHADLAIATAAQLARLDEAVDAGQLFGAPLHARYRLPHADYPATVCVMQGEAENFTYYAIPRKDDRILLIRYTGPVPDVQGALPPLLAELVANTLLTVPVAARP